MTVLHKVEGHTNLRKDLYSGGIINVDKNSYNSYQNTKRLALQQLQEKHQIKEDVKDLRNEINNIKEQVSDIKDLLMQLINKGQ